jgi:hypothetical protein
MSKSKGKTQLEDSDSSQSEEEVKAPPPKKSKSAPKATASTKKTDESTDDNRFHLDRTRFVTVREFKGRIMIDIREFYEADGELKPGKKGISLTPVQWNKLKDQIDDIDEAIKSF